MRNAAGTIERLMGHVTLDTILALQYFSFTNADGCAACLANWFQEKLDAMSKEVDELLIPARECLAKVKPCDLATNATTDMRAAILQRWGDVARDLGVVNGRDTAQTQDCQ